MFFVFGNLFRTKNVENKPTSSPNTVPFSLPGSLFGRKNQAILLNINPNHLRFLFLHAHGTRPAPPSPNGASAAVPLPPIPDVVPFSLQDHFLTPFSSKIIEIPNFR